MFGWKPGQLNGRGRHKDGAREILNARLTNEVVIGLKDKNRFNASEPKDDGQFIDYVTHPTVPTRLEILFGAAGVRAPTNFPRTDLVAAFLTGIEGVNKPAGGATAEMLRLLRLNTSIAPTPAGVQTIASGSLSS